MSTITIHSDNENQINLLQILLKELEMQFEISTDEELTDWQKKEIDLGITDIKAGRFSSSKEVSKKARLCLK